MKLNAAQVLGLAAAGVALGHWLKRRIPWFPAPILGGLVCALTVWALHARGIAVEFDTTLRDVLMLSVFTLIGLNASVSLVRRGGVLVGMLLALASLGAVLQNLAGMGLARAFGLNPLVGVLAGAVSLAGGPATSLAFGPVFERAGVAGATAIATASAAFGIAISGFVAGPLGAWLIRRYRLSSQQETVSGGGASGIAGSVLGHAVVIGFAIGAGSLLSLAIERAGVVLPGYIGAMCVAAVLRYIDDRTGWLRLSSAQMAALGEAALALFIVMAMLALKLWELATLAIPLLAILIAQTVFTVIVSGTLVFAVMRRDYTAAVISTGFCGFMLGITANALAAMDDLTRRYGPSPRAFLVAPVVGAFLIDFTNALVITFTLNLVR